MVSYYNYTERVRCVGDVWDVWDVCVYEMSKNQTHLFHQSIHLGNFPHQFLVHLIHP